MKLAFSTLPCAAWSLEYTLKICKEYNIDAIELRLDLNDWSDSNMSQEKAEDMLRLLKEYNIKITSLGTQVRVDSHDSSQKKQFTKCVELANKLQTRALRIMLGNFRTRWTEIKPTPDYEGIVRWLQEAAEIASAENIEIWIETHNEFSTGKVLKKLLEDVKSNNCKIVWDIMHPLEQNESLTETISFIEKDIAHIHIKDGIPWEDKDLASWKYTKLGEGIIPIHEVVKLLKETGYDGYYSLEWESTWRPEIRGEGCKGEAVISHFAEFMKNIVY
jgi:sugar phosphate isomerase/epimerase